MSSIERALNAPNSAENRPHSLFSAISGHLAVAKCPAHVVGRVVRRPLLPAGSRRRVFLIRRMQSWEALVEGVLTTWHDPPSHFSCRPLRATSAWVTAAAPLHTLFAPVVSPSCGGGPLGQVACCRAQLTFSVTPKFAREPSSNSKPPTIFAPH